MQIHLLTVHNVVELFSHFTQPLLFANRIQVIGEYLRGLSTTENEGIREIVSEF